MITDKNKSKIAISLEEYITNIGSAQKAAISLDISGATVSNIRSGKWQNIKDEMWRHVAAATGYQKDTWEAVETRDYKTLSAIFAHCQEEGAVAAVTGEAGTGKSFTIRNYCNNNANAYALQCNEFWNRKYFLAELLRVMGKDCSGLTVAEMMQEVVGHLKKQHNPLLIIDEADKLTDQVLYFFITLYNQLEERCGIVLCATDHLEKRIKRGLRLNKKGYKEIYSRVNRKFIALKGPGIKDVTAICMANGVNDRQTVRNIWEDCEGDLRRVKQKLKAISRPSNPLKIETDAA